MASAATFAWQAGLAGLAVPFTTSVTTGASAAAAGASTAAKIIAGTLIAGTGLQTVGIYGQGVAAQQAAKAQAKTYEYNARIQEQQAERERQAAKYEADLRRERGRKLLATQRVGFAKAGVSATGSPLLVFEQTARDIAEDVAMTRWGGTQRASYYESEAGLSRMYGSAAKQGGRAAYAGGVMGAGASLLTGAAQGIYAYRTMR